MKEATIGSLPWFAGVFWLALSAVSLHLAHGFFFLGDKVTLLQRPAWGFAWKLIHLTNRTNKLAYTCALEAGAEDN